MSPEVPWSGLRVSAFEPGVAREYLGVVASVGYETRSRFVSESLGHAASRVWAADYGTNRVFAYPENRRFFEGLDAVVEVDEESYRKQLASDVSAWVQAWREARDTLGGIRQDSSPAPKIAVDISSMDRDRLTRTAFALLVDQHGPLEVDFVYAPAEFDQNLVGSAGTVLVNRPAYGLEGWTADPSLPLTCVLGTGFELELALAALETLEPAETVLFVPRGEDPRYDEVVDKRNAELGMLYTQAFEYSIMSPYRLLRDLEAFCHAMMGSARITIVPLGPKVFALASVLVGIGYSQGQGGGDVTVWRMSADYGRAPEDRRPTGSIVGLTVHLS